MRRIVWGAVVNSVVAVTGLALLFTTAGWWPGIVLVVALIVGVELILQTW